MTYPVGHQLSTCISSWVNTWQYRFVTLTAICLIGWYIAISVHMFFFYKTGGDRSPTDYNIYLKSKNRVTESVSRNKKIREIAKRLSIYNCIVGQIVLLALSRTQSNSFLNKKMQCPSSNLGKLVV